MPGRPLILAVVLVLGFITDSAKRYQGVPYVRETQPVWGMVVTAATILFVLIMNGYYLLKEKE